jgi:F420-dependent oxidoreductase-like protein
MHRLNHSRRHNPFHSTTLVAGGDRGMTVGRLSSGTMELRIFVEPQQGASYETLLAAAQTSEKAGFDAFFRSDHYLKMGSVSGAPGPTDTWVTMAGLARETKTIKLGTLVTSATFRHPGPLAVSVAQVDQMSGGRVELGLGAGWYEAEHDAFGIPFHTLGERFDRFEDQLAILKGLWAPEISYENPFSYSGKHHSVTNAPGLPKPAGNLPIIIGGGGAKKTPRLAATYAAEFNAPFRSAESAKELFAAVRIACEKAERNPQSMIMSAALVSAFGNTSAEVERRAKAIGREVGELRENGLCGSAKEMADKLSTFRMAGATRAYVQILDLSDLAHIEELGAELLPLVKDL